MPWRSGDWRLRWFSSLLPSTSQVCQKDTRITWLAQIPPIQFENVRVRISWDSHRGCQTPASALPPPPLRFPLEVNCLDTCYPRLKAYEALSEYARGGRASLLSRKGWARLPTFTDDPERSGGAAVSAGGLASIIGTIWLCFPACTAFPVLCSQNSGKSSSPPNYSLVNTRWTRNSGEKDFNLISSLKEEYFKICFLVFFFLLFGLAMWHVRS